MSTDRQPDDILNREKERSTVQIVRKQRRIVKRKKVSCWYKQADVSAEHQHNRIGKAHETVDTDQKAIMLTVEMTAR